MMLAGVLILESSDQMRYRAFHDDNQFMLLISMFKACKASVCVGCNMPSNQPGQAENTDVKLN